MATLERVCAEVGYPDSIRVDQGSEFVSRDLDMWAYQNEVTLDFSRPGKPTDNAFIEAFNGRLRPECLNSHWFLTLEDAREKLERWRRDCNEVRPHGAIGNKAPITLVDRPGSNQPGRAIRSGIFQLPVRERRAQTGSQEMIIDRGEVGDCGDNHVGRAVADS